MLFNIYNHVRVNFTMDIIITEKKFNVLKFSVILLVHLTGDNYLLTLKCSIKVTYLYFI